MELRDKIALALIAEVERQTEGRWPIIHREGDLSGGVDDYLAFAEIADAILAIPEVRVGLADTKAVTAAIAEFEAKGMESARGILAWHIREALTANTQ